VWDELASGKIVDLWVASLLFRRQFYVVDEVSIHGNRV
jgi:hypothetical protein